MKEIYTEIRSNAVIVEEVCEREREREREREERVDQRSDKGDSI